MHSRMLRHRVVTGAVTLALALGGVAATGAAASADSSADRVSAQCQQARKDLSAAKKKLRAAKRADNAAKIKKAQKKVKAAKARKASACAAPTQESVLEQVQQDQLALSNLDTGAISALLPAQLAGAVGALVTKLQTSLDAVEAQVPGADAAKLEALAAAVTAMDAQGVVKAMQSLAAALTAGGASPASINTVIQMLQGPLPTGNLAIPGIPQLKSMLDQLTAGLPLLAGVDLTDAATAESVMGQLKGGLAAITDNVKGDSSGWLGGLTELTKQLGDLGVVNPGAPGSGAALANVLTALLGLAAGSPDPLGALTTVLGNGSLGSILVLVGIPVGGLLGVV